MSATTANRITRMTVAESRALRSVPRYIAFGAAAMDAYDRGDFAEATRLLDEQRALGGYRAPSVAAQRAEDARTMRAERR